MRSKLTAIPFLVLMIGVLFSSCGRKTEPIPEHLIQPEQMRSILLDIHVVEAYQDQLGLKGDTVVQMMQGFYANIFAKHDISEDEFYESFNYYETHPDKMDAMYEKIIEDLIKLEATMPGKQEKPQLPQQDTSSKKQL